MRVLIIGSLFLTASTAFAGNYNFYFNNGEQGNDSTSNPTVQDGSGSTVKTASEEKTASVPASDPQGVLGTNIDQYLFDNTTFRHFSLGLGFAFLNHYAHGSMDFGGADDYPAYPGQSDKYVNNDGLVLTAGYDLNRNIGIRAFATTYQTSSYGDDSAPLIKSRSWWMGGADVEATPIHVRVGKRENFIDLGALAGASILKEESNSVRFVGGARVNVNVSSSLQVTSSYRFSPDSYEMFEAGVAVRL